MKITWIVPGYQSDAADRCIPALTDLAHRVARDHFLKVYALQYPGREDCYRVGEIEIRSFKHGPKLTRPGTLARAIWLLRQEKADLVHAFWAAEPALVGAAANALKKRPLVVSCMGGEPVYLPEIGYGAAGKRLDRLYLQLAVRGSQLITAGSEKQAEFLRRKFGRRMDPVIMPLGIDLDRFQATGGPLAEKPLILAAGSLLPVKGHAHLIEAINKFPQVRLRIVGDGPERAKLQALVDRLGLNDRVCLAGAVLPEDMATEYAKASLLALPSYYESQCMVLLEAMACGLPVVAAPVGLAPELLADGKAGELAAINRPEDLAGTINRLFNRENEWPELQKAARSAAERYSLDNCVKNLVDLYERIIEKRSAP